MIPPEDHVLHNRPPRILTRRMDPATGAVRGPIDTCRPELRVPVEELDRGNRVYTRWMLNPHLGPQTPLFEFDRSQVSDGGTVEASLSLDFQRHLPGVGTHVVELLAADGPLTGRDPEPRDVGGMSVTTYVDSFRWIIQVDPPASNPDAGCK